MIRYYTFEYSTYEAEAFFKVDTSKLKEDDAENLLEFFIWDYDKSADPIDELMKKYAMTEIKVATFEEFNEYGVKCWFAEQEGFIPIDGSKGVELISVSPYEFDEAYLGMEVQHD